jgi:hypothetical protein
VLLSGGCSTQLGPRTARLAPAATPASELLSLGLSPVAELVSPREAWTLAESYARQHEGCEVLVGSGDSMLPFYHDRTVLVVARLAMNEVRVGMTVIFTGESGRPVAHLLTEKTTRGWRTRGVGNDEDDRALVYYDNYIGTVVKAYAPALLPTPGEASTRVAASGQ